MRCGECAAKVAVTARVCSRCGASIVGQPTVVGAVIRQLRECYEGTNVAGVVLMCASALVGIFFILGSVWLYKDDSVSQWIFLGFGLFFLGWPAMPVVVGVFEADGPVGRRLARVRPARRQPETPPKVAEQAPPEPFVPGSGATLPAELRLVLSGYAGIACGWSAGALACAAAAVFVIFDADIRSAVFEFFDADIVESLVAAVPVCGLGLWSALMAFEALQARIRFPGCSGGPAINALRL